MRIDCKLSGWSKLGGCSKKCGGGNQMLSRSIIRTPLNGGKACPTEAGAYLVQSRKPCNTHKCPIVSGPRAAVDCVMSTFAPVGQCSKACGGGQQTLSRIVITPAANGGLKCPSAASNTKVSPKPCNTHSCPPGLKDRDCVMSAFVKTGKCTKKCGSGKQMLTRHVIKTTVGRGQACPLAAANVKWVSCNTHKCGSSTPTPTKAPARSCWTTKWQRPPRHVKECRWKAATLRKLAKLLHGKCSKWGRLMQKAVGKKSKKYAEAKRSAYCQREKLVLAKSKEWAHKAKQVQSLLARADSLSRQARSWGELANKATALATEARDLKRRAQKWELLVKQSAKSSKSKSQVIKRAAKLQAQQLVTKAKTLNMLALKYARVAKQLKGKAATKAKEQAKRLLKQAQQTKRLAKKWRKAAASPRRVLDAAKDRASALGQKVIQKARAAAKLAKKVKTVMGYFVLARNARHQAKALLEKPVCPLPTEADLHKDQEYRKIKDKLNKVLDRGRKWLHDLQQITEVYAPPRVDPPIIEVHVVSPGNSVVITGVPPASMGDLNKTISGFGPTVTVVLPPPPKVEDKTDHAGEITGFDTFARCVTSRPKAKMTAYSGVLTFDVDTFDSAARKQLAFDYFEYITEFQMEMHLLAAEHRADSHHWFKEDLYNTWQRGGELNLHGLDVEEWYANIQTRAQAGDVLALSILEGTAPFPKVPTNAAEFRKLVGRGRWVVPKGTSAALEGASESRVVLRRISEREE